MSFLDKAKGISLRGGVPEQVLLALALRALPKDLASRLIMWGQSHGNGLTWDTMYDACNQWEITGLISHTPVEVNEVTSGHRYPRQGQRPGGLKRKCSFCEKSGHSTDNCFKLRDWKRGQHGVNQNTAEQAARGQDDSNHPNKGPTIYSSSSLGRSLKRPMAIINTSWRQCSALIDTGSDLNLIRSDIIKSKKWQPSELTIRNANGGPSGSRRN